MICLLICLLLQILELIQVLAYILHNKIISLNSRYNNKHELFVGPLGVVVVAVEVDPVELD
jgi:hypothetical protein